MAGAHAELAFGGLAQLGQFAALLPLGGEERDLLHYLLGRKEGVGVVQERGHAVDIVAVHLHGVGHQLGVLLAQAVALHVVAGLGELLFQGGDLFVERPLDVVRRRAQYGDVGRCGECAVDADAAVFQEEMDEGLLLVGSALPLKTKSPLVTLAESMTSTSPV